MLAEWISESGINAHDNLSWSLTEEETNDDTVSDDEADEKEGEGEEEDHDDKDETSSKAYKVSDTEAEDFKSLPKSDACTVCHKTRTPEKILLCDNCDAGYHTFCLTPKLSSVCCVFPLLIR